jgi:hypothetical protein
VLGLVLSFVALVGVMLVLRLLRRRPAPPPLPEVAPLQGTPPYRSWYDRPRPGELWLAGDDQVLVVRTLSDGVDVLPVLLTGPGDEPRHLPDTALTARRGQIDAAAWTRIQRTHPTGYAS